jgi:tetratricopeptide (TPR) repeat protein
MMSLKRGARVGVVLLVGAAGLACGVGAVAQPQPAPAAQQPAERRTPEILANALARLAIFDLRATANPGEADYRIATALLGLAREQKPKDGEILRRQIEAAYGAGDNALVQELTRALLVVDPNDTVAQLRLITASIATNNQTAEQRLESYEKFLGPEGKAFRPEIRSRLALDAALLLRERGDTKGFVDRLKDSLRLDPTHKEAAALAVAYFADRLPEDRLGRLTLLQNLLMADPVDPHVHLSIARELAAGGAFKGANRFYRIAMAISQSSGGQPDADVQMQATVIRWHDVGPAVVAREIREQLLQARAEAAVALRRLEGRFEGGHIPEGVRRPEDILVPMDIAPLVIAAGDAAGDPEISKWAYTELVQTVRKTVEELQDPVKRQGIGEERASQMTAQVLMSLCWIRAWSGQEADLVRGDLDKNPALAQIFPEISKVIDGYLKLREGDAAAALELFKPLQDQHMLARVGVGQAQEKAGHQALAVQTYESILRDAPLSYFGAWARARMVALGWTEPRGDSVALERAAAQIPDWIDRAITNPAQYVQITLAPMNRTPDALDAVAIRVTLQNLAPIPLALGADRALNSRLLMAPKVEADAAVELPWFRPEVVDIDRRLRLLPNERLDVVVQPDLGGLGWAAESLGNRTLRVRWRATQGAVFQGGGFHPGAMCLVADSDSVMRRPLAEAEMGARVMLEQIQLAPGDGVTRLAAAVRAHIMQPMLMPTEAERAMLADPAARARYVEAQTEGIKLIAESMAARYPSLAPEERAAVAALLPHAGLAPGMKAFDDVARQEEHPLPLSVVLVTRVTAASDELLAKAGGSADPAIRQLAFAVAERLGGQERTYARLTMDVMAGILLGKALEQPK